MCSRVDTAIIAISNDSTFKGKFRSLARNFQATEQSLESCLKGIATSLLVKPTNNGCLVALLLLSLELDSSHSTHSVWYKRDVLIETLYNIFTEYNDIFHKMNYYFQGLSFILLVFSLILIVL